MPERQGADASHPGGARAVAGAPCALRRAMLLVGVALGSGAPLARALPTSDYPNKPVTLTVGFPAGGSTDVIARGLAAALQRVWNQTVIVENISGAGGSIGAQRYLNGKHDGYTLFTSTPIEIIQTPLAMKVKYKSEDFRLIGLMGTSNMFLLVRPTLEVTTVQELVNLSHKLANGKELSFGSVGRGSGFHLVAEKFVSDVAVKAIHVPYKGVAPMLADLAGSQIDFAFMTLGGPVMGMIKTGRFKAIGFASAQRHPDFPDVPTMDESGLVKNFSYDLWAGLVAAKATPEPIVQQLSAALNEVLRQPQFRGEIEGSGVTLASPMTLDEAAERYAVDVARYRAIAQSIHLQPE